MTETVESILESIGFATVCVVIGYLAVFIFNWICDSINTWEDRRKDKKNSKPPKAKCYCKDCRYWNTYVNVKVCTINKELVPRADWFCHDADPRKEGE